MNRFYVFALASEACDPFECTGHVIESIEMQGVYALVERSDRPPVVSEQALRDQHEVIAQLHARSDALLPARFGAFLDARELESIVEQRRKAIVEALRLVRGRSQMTIRLLVAEPTGAVRSVTGSQSRSDGNRVPREPKGIAVRVARCTERRVRGRSRHCRRRAV